MPAASSTARPSAVTRRRSSVACSQASWPHTASVALLRLASSLPYFHRITSAVTGARKPLAVRSAPICSAVASAPDGYRPMCRPGQRDAVRLDHARLQVRGRQPHAHSVHPAEAAQRDPLAGHPVLRAHHRQRVRGVLPAGCFAPAARPSRPAAARRPGSWSPAGGRRPRGGRVLRGPLRRGCPAWTCRPGWPGSGPWRGGRRGGRRGRPGRPRARWRPACRRWCRRSRRPR